MKICEQLLKAQVVKTNRTRTQQLQSTRVNVQNINKYKPDSLHVYIVNHVYIVKIMFTL